MATASAASSSASAASSSRSSSSASAAKRTDAARKILLDYAAACDAKRELSHRAQQRWVATAINCVLEKCPARGEPVWCLGNGSWRQGRGMQSSAWPALKDYLLRRYTVVFVDEVRVLLGYWLL